MSAQSPAHKRNLLILHLTVFVWGFTGVLGAVITTPPIQLVWYRVLIAFLTLLVYFRLSRASLKLDIKAAMKLLLTGGIVGLHWILFFAAIKASTVSVTLVCLSSLTLFTAILEPILSRRKLGFLEIFTGLAIISGIYLIFEFEGHYTRGIIFGLSSAFCASLFSIINSKQIQNRDASVISFYELVGAWIWISIYMMLVGGFNSALKLSLIDSFYLLILGTLCTSVAYVAGVAVMKTLSAFRVALITNLEPVYGIILAFIFLGKREHMTLGFYAGSLIILSAIFLYPILKTRLTNRRLAKQQPLT